MSKLCRWPTCTSPVARMPCLKMYHSCRFIAQQIPGDNSFLHQRIHSRTTCGSTADLTAPCYGTQGYYRGARAALKLRDYEIALQLCSRGMEIDGKAPELQQLRQEAEKQAKVCTCTSSIFDMRYLVHIIK